MARAAAALLGGEVARMEPLGGGCLEEVTRVTLHASEGVRYGWATDYPYGPVALPNAATEEWPAFWAERRLLAHADALPADLARRVAALAAELPLRLAQARMRILIDTDVVLDMPMARRPHVDHALAVVAGADAIVSRDGAGFAASSLPVFTPAAFLAAVRGELH